MRRQVQTSEKEENFLVNGYSIVFIYMFKFFDIGLVQDEKAEGFVSLPEFKIDRASECRKK